MDIYDQILSNRHFELLSGTTYNANKIRDAISRRSDRKDMWFNLPNKHIEKTEKLFRAQEKLWKKNLGLLKNQRKLGM